MLMNAKKKKVNLGFLIFVHEKMFIFGIYVLNGKQKLLSDWKKYY